MGYIVLLSMHQNDIHQNPAKQNFKDCDSLLVENRVAISSILKFSKSSLFFHRSKHIFLYTASKRKRNLMLNWIIDIMNRYGYAGVAALIGIENIFPPIPSEVILTFGGFITTCSDLTFTGVVLSATAGSLLGAVILYQAGYLLSFEKLCRILSGKTGKVLHLYPQDIQKAVDWFDKKGNITVFFCRFIPIVRSLISIPAGCAKMKMMPFLLLTTAGSFIWNTALVWLGALAGESWGRIAAYLKAYSHIAMIILVISGISALYYFVKNKAGA